MEIRKAVKRDFNGIKEVYLEGIVDEFHTQYPKKKRSKIFQESFVTERLGKMKKALSSNKECIIVGEDAEKIIGFGHFKIVKGKIGFLDKGYVKKNFRNKGVAKKITQDGLEWFSKKQIHVLRAVIFVNNVPSSSLIKSFGFKPRHITWEKYT